MLYFDEPPFATYLILYENGSGHRKPRRGEDFSELSCAELGIRGRSCAEKFCPITKIAIILEATMGLLGKFLERRKLSKAKAHAKQISFLIAPFINATGELAHCSIQRNVKSWDLSNPTLVNYLGYIAGVIDAADQALGHSSTTDWTATEIVFHQVIEGQFGALDGIEAFLEVNKMGIECGGTIIQWLQEDQKFLAAMQLGGNDFLEVGQLGYFQRGLFELGLITGGKSSE